MGEQYAVLLGMSLCVQRKNASVHRNKNFTAKDVMARSRVESDVYWLSIVLDAKLHCSKHTARGNLLIYAQI